VLRFAARLDAVAWVNMVVVWALAHQAGLSYPALRDAPRRVGWILLTGGMVVLVGLVSSGRYPASMIGVYGDRFSNAAPPTVAIVALLLAQIGAAVLLRPAVMRAARYWRRTVASVNRTALPLYLFHTTGATAAMAIPVLLLGQPVATPTPPDAWWWVGRPVVLLASVAFTVPLVWLYLRGRARLVPARVAQRPDVPVLVESGAVG
jgi:hypothetical protein